MAVMQRGAEGSAAKNRSSTSSPEDAQIIQSKVHKFLFAKEKRESNDNAKRSIAVSIRELALDYKGKAFQGNDYTRRHWSVCMVSVTGSGSLDC